MTEVDQQRLVFECTRLFSPAAPIDKLELFSGRLPQLRLISSAIGTRGQHAIIFGERGVGKTSLASILDDLLKNEKVRVVKVNCAENESFAEIWARIFSEISLESKIGFSPLPTQATHNLGDMITGPISPGEVRKALQYLSTKSESVIILDEFDRLRTSETPAAFSDVIKDLSDNGVRSTLILVGVARNVDDLIAEHASIDRALVQVKMPRMSTSELEQIIKNRVNTLKLSITPESLRLIVLLSQGLPHYTHLLGVESTLSAIQDRRHSIARPDVEAGIRSAIEKSKHTIGNIYYKATSSKKKITLFKEVLLACALARVDEFGSFSSSDVRAPLKQITGKDYDIPNFSQHLDKFSSDAMRGSILEKPHRFRFRFRNPLLQPYIIMKGLVDKLISDDLLALLENKETGNPAAELLF